jgi:hypothetical protein
MYAENIQITPMGSQETMTKQCSRFDLVVKKVLDAEKNLEKIDTGLEGELTDELVNDRKQDEREIEVKTIYDEAVSAKEAEIKRVEIEIETLNLSISSLQTKIAGLNVTLEGAAESDKADLKEQRKDLEREIGKKRSRVDTATDHKDILVKELSILSTKRAEMAGLVDGSKKARSSTGERKESQRETLEKIISTNQEKLSEMAKETAADLTMTMNFAPASYIDLLREQNRGLDFRYVPVIAGAIDTTFPMPDSEHAQRVGFKRPILDAYPSSSENAFKKKSMFNLTTEAAKEGDKLTFATIRELMMQYSDSLEGRRNLTLTVGLPAFCAYMTDKKMGDRYIVTPETYKLALFYSYPMTFDIEMTGQFKSFNFLKTLYERKKSSGFFSSSDRTKFTQEAKYREEIDIRVVSSSPLFSADDQEKMRQKVQDYLAFRVSQPFLDLGSKPNIPTPGLPEGKNGAQQIGGFIGSIPNPWTFWTGGLLNVLGGAFGSKKVSVEQIIQQWKDYKYHSYGQFTAPIAATVTVGDLKDADLVWKK